MTSTTGTSFATALLTARTPVVMELKRRSAQGADLFRGRTPAELAALYEEMGAPALSVVTGRWFGGGPELLAEVVAATGLPVLVKDFLTKERQLAEAAARGASAVLLTAGLLPRTLLPRMIESCLGHGLTPFVEVTAERELASLVHADRCVVAVNNKDIRQRERDAGDLGRSRALLPAVLATGTPVPVSASGIRTPAEAAGLLAAGYRALLVGTGLLLQDDLRAWFADLERQRERIR
ncbi:indole-3-glycerol-phosphate synthase [Streptomyces sp. XD-27]|uniref:indole-3-glycerol-phosphate synthase n=1 Tax=Streptomyces sp. XD-27 TaxID=3062779 RepID=UPI0026F412F9|nr:indole-3-glycerol-phosphate synthase [Streptomyces sp. XD-27]WKX69269.1 indole-3-glycerol-phosphate synthase [Streptomyces sp. XD-27]